MLTAQAIVDMILISGAWPVALNPTCGDLSPLRGAPAILEIGPCLVISDGNWSLSDDIQVLVLFLYHKIILQESTPSITLLLNPFSKLTITFPV